jgi:acyl-CoA reductase-like NAD-dependent aldehyde dehydrogenase
MKLPIASIEAMLQDVPIRKRTSLSAAVETAMTSARATQVRWTHTPLPRRLELIRELRRLIAENSLELAEASAAARQRPAPESLAAEVLPLAEACRFLEREAGKILAPRRLGRSGLPIWLAGVHSEIHHEPFGVILIIGPGNYPLLLPGVQIVQALAAGNAVLLKPGLGGTASARALIGLLARAGFDPQLVGLLPESPEAVRAAIAVRPDKVILTGSVQTGEKILAQLAPHLIPATMELSGWDAVIIRADADLDLAVKALVFGMKLNNGATCLSPKRAFVHYSLAAELERRLEHVFAPEFSIVPFADDDEAVLRANDCDFGLGASIFSRNESAAHWLAAQINVGVVTINDVIVPTADARIPFGGRGRSGFGVTRGAEGLLELTTPKVITLSRGTFRPAFDPPQSSDAQMFQAYLKLAHGRGLKSRWHALLSLIQIIAHRTKSFPREKL